MKIGLIRCLQTEDMCPATTCFKVIKNKKGAFENVEGDIEIVGINTCGGCPGKKAITRAKKMIHLGADTIVLASCMKKGTPIGFPCPYYDTIHDAIKKRFETIEVLTYSH